MYILTISIWKKSGLKNVRPQQCWRRYTYSCLSRYKRKARNTSNIKGGGGVGDIYILKKHGRQNLGKIRANWIIIVIAFYIIPKFC